MTYEFCEYDLKLIAKLPPSIQALKEKYPVSIVNAAEYWDEPPLPEGYIPGDVEVFYGDDVNDSDLLILNGNLDSFTLEEPEGEPPVMSVLIDGSWAYIQIEGQIILNRLGGVALPDVLVDPAALLQSVLKSNPVI
jgi:hypothetical protein